MESNTNVLEASYKNPRLNGANVHWEGRQWGMTILAPVMLRLDIDNRRKPCTCMSSCESS